MTEAHTHPLSGQEILFTRQRHEADRMGLHWDYRFVLGDKAYSWATKKEMPEPGKAIILFEQPVHTAHYALSERIEIPPGNYGAGKSFLDYCYKATVEPNEYEPGKIVVNVKNGQRFLLKKMGDGLYGDKAWLFKNLTKLEKKSHMAENKYLTKISMGPISGALAIAAGTHFAQNLGMKAALKSKALRQHVANGFSQGLKGVVDTSAKAKIGRFAAGATLPEVNALHAAGHAAGVKLAPHLNNMSLKEKAGLHALVTGKHSAGVLGLAAKNPKIQEAYSVIQKQHNLRPLHEIEPIARNSVSTSNNPLITNIIGGIHKGKNPIGPQFKPGTPSAKAGVLGSVASMVLEPAAGGVNLAKNLTTSNTFKKTRVGGKISEGLEHVFVKNPFNKGREHGYVHGKLKDLGNDLAMGPINTQLKDLGSQVRKLQNPA